jgi:hypothetical protein
MKQTENVPPANVRKINHVGTRRTIRMLDPFETPALIIALQRPIHDEYWSFSDSSCSLPAGTVGSAVDVRLVVSQWSAGNRRPSAGLTATLVLSSEIQLVKSAYLENVMREEPGLIAINERASTRSRGRRLSPLPSPACGEHPVPVLGTLREDTSGPCNSGIISTNDATTYKGEYCPA